MVQQCRLIIKQHLVFALVYVTVSSLDNLSDDRFRGPLSGCLEKSNERKLLLHCYSKDQIFLYLPTWKYNLFLHFNTAHLKFGSV